MRESLVETLIGAVVLAVAGVFLWFAMATGGEAGTSGDRYTVSARFNSVSGINRGADVRLAGMKVGAVQNITPDYETFEAVVTLAIDRGFDNLPEDTDARVTQDGLLGGSYVALEPGGSFETIPTDGSGEIIYTRGSVDLLTLVGSLTSGTQSSGGE